MKTAAWRMKHIESGDLALEDARTLLASTRQIDMERAKVFVDLACAHYRAVEVERQIAAGAGSWPKF